MGYADMTLPAVLKSLSAEEAQAEMLRQRAIVLNWAFYHGRILPPAERGETPDHYERRVKLVINLVRRIIRIKRSFLYGTGIITGIRPAAHAKIIDTVHKDNDIDRFRLKLATVGMVSGTAIVNPMWVVEEDGPRVKYRLIPAENARVQIDPLNPDRLRQFSFRSEWIDPSDERTTHVKWDIVTDVFWHVYINDKRMPELEAEGGRNPYGFIPFVFFRNNEDAEFPWGGSEVADLLNLQNELNCRASDASNVVKHHGSPLVVTKGAAGQIVVGPDKLIELQSPESSIEYLTWSQDMPGALSLMDRHVDWLGAVSDCPAPELMNLEGIGNLTSAVALQMLYKPLSRLTGEARLQYGAGERELATATVRVYGVHVPGQVVDHRKMDVECGWPREPVPVNELEELQAKQMRRELGLETQRDQLKDNHPDWNDKRIDEYIAEIEEERQARVRTIASTMTGRETTQLNSMFADLERGQGAEE